MPNLRPAVLTVVAALVAVVVGRVLEPLERISFDFRLSLRRDAGWPEDLLLVPIDDEAMRIHGRWPWPRETQGALLQTLRALGAKTVVFDAVPGSQTTPASDAALAKAMPGSILAIGFAHLGGEAIVPASVRASMIPARAHAGARVKAEELVPPIELFASRADGLGHAILRTQSDSRVRTHIPLLNVDGIDDASLPSLPLSAMLRHRGFDPLGVRVEGNRLILPDGRAHALYGGEMYLDLVPGKPGPAKLRAVDVLGRGPGTSVDVPALRARLDGKLVLVHVDSISSPDSLASPISSTTPGGVLIAYAIRTLEGSRAPIPLPRIPIFAASVALALALSGWAARRPPNHVLAASASAVVGMVVLGVALVPLADLFLPVVLSTTFFALTGGVLAAYGGRRAETERRQLQALLKATLSAASAPAVAAQPVSSIGPEPPTVAGPPAYGEVEAPTVAGKSGSGSGVATNPQRFPEIGKPLDQPVIVGRYVIQRAIGRGGMGAIFLARDQDLDRYVAIKVLEEADDAEYRRFRREAMAVARIVHPNVVQIHEIGFNAASPYIVMEYVPGGTLSDLLRDPEVTLPLPWQQATRIMVGAARGLGAAHAHGIVHRDVKPANLLLTEKRGTVAKIADFGIAKLAGAEALTREGSFVGTIGYLAPEQATGGAVDARSDVFSLGITWYRMLTGRLAFEGSTAQVLRSTVYMECPDPREVNGTLPDAIAELVLRMTANDRAKRPRDGNVVADAMELLLEGAKTLAASGPSS